MGGPLAEISPLWRSLMELCLEYTDLLGGRKATKYFTERERTKVKVPVLPLKNGLLQDCVSKHVNTGYIVNMVLTKIRDCYGQYIPVSNILAEMAKDKKIGAGDSNLIM